MRQVIIVGTGIAALSAAQTLRESDWQVRIIDKGQAIGGRFVTRWSGKRDRRVDLGAQFLTARDPDFAATVAQWERDGWVRRWCDGIPVLTADGLDHSKDGYPRYIGAHGMHDLARRLAAGLTIMHNATVVDLQRVSEGWSVGWMSGDAMRGLAYGVRQRDHADAIILTQPAPQIIHLLDQSGMPVPMALHAIRYAPCIGVCVDLPKASDMVLPEPGAVRVEDPGSALCWLSSSRGRGLVQTGDVLLMHGSPLWSEARHATDTEQAGRSLVRDATATLQRLGITADLTDLRADAMQWRYSRCVESCAQPFIHIDKTAPLLIAGDGFGENPRVEGAWLSGRKAALRLLEKC